MNFSIQVAETKVLWIKEAEGLIYIAETKALISCVVTVQLICAFVFAYVKVGFSHDAAQICLRYIP